MHALLDMILKLLPFLLGRLQFCSSVSEFRLKGMFWDLECSCKLCMSIKQVTSKNNVSPKQNLLIYIEEKVPVAYLCINI